MVKLPKNIIWSQNNQSDKFGDLWSSFNLDLNSKIGFLKPSPRMILNESEAVLTNMTSAPCAFKYFSTSSNNIWTIAAGRVFTSADAGSSSGGANTTFTQDDIGGTPTDLSSDKGDIELFDSAAYFSGASSNSLYKLATAGSWSTLSNKLTDTSGIKAMVYFRATNRLYIIDDNQAGVTSLDTSDTAVLSSSGSQYSLNDLVEGAGVGYGHRLTWIIATTTRIWLGTINLSGNQSYIYAWDGSQSSGANEVYLIEDAGSLSAVVKDDTPYIFTSRGRLLSFNGGTFVELDRLPFGKENPLSFSTPTLNMVHYNGMIVDEDMIKILVNATLYDTNSTNLENIHSGIWTYTKETGLYHSASLGLSKSGDSTTDYGAQKLSAIGGLAKVELAFGSNITQGSTNGRLLAGADYYTNATTVKSGIWYDDTANTLQSACSFITSKFYSLNIDDIWQKIYIRFRKFLTATDKMVVKYRTSETTPSEFTITWASTTSFTTSTNLIGKEGYEIEVLNGVGAGRCFHVSTVGYNQTNYIATCDETVTGATGTAKVRMQNWTKLGSYSAQTEDFSSWPIDTGNSTWIQFKVWFLSTGENEIVDLNLVNQTNQKQ